MDIVAFKLNFTKIILKRTLKKITGEGELRMWKDSVNKGFLRRPFRTQMPEERTGRHHPAPGPRPTLDIFVDLKKKKKGTFMKKMCH